MIDPRPNALEHACAVLKRKCKVDQKTIDLHERPNFFHVFPIFIGQVLRLLLEE